MDVHTHVNRPLYHDLGQKYQAPQVRPDQGSNSSPDQDSTIQCHWGAFSNHLAISDF